MSNVKIHWTLIIGISSLGLIHGVLSLFGLVQGWEMIIWSSIAIISMALVARLKTNIFLNGILMGLGVTLFTGLPQSIFLNTYLLNNPEYAEALDPGRNYALFILLFIPIFGSVYGLIIGLISWILHRAVN